MTQTLAIVERLPGHTEVMGGFAALAIELGYEVHLLFNHTDPFQMVEYFGARLGIDADHIHEWSHINDPNFHCDAILLNTSYVWLDYGFQLRQWDSTKQLIVVHHLPEDIELNPHGESLYLTPAVDERKWIFPLYGKPAAANELAQDESAAGNGAENPSDCDLPSLVTIGALDLKDLAGISAYMKAGGKIAHYDRHKCHHFPNESGYTQHVALTGMEFMGSLRKRTQPIFLWFPILPESVYMVYRFTGAVIMGVDLSCIMVMPERFRKLYGFPEDAVIAYQSSVLEPECVEKLRESKEKQIERRKQLRTWATERWEKNLEIFRRLLSTPRTNNAKNPSANLGNV
jgi:hypothetical protein